MSAFLCLDLPTVYHVFLLYKADQNDPTGSPFAELENPGMKPYQHAYPFISRLWRKDQIAPVALLTQ